LPEAGKPAHFSGAVGKFTVSAKLSATSVQPGDILTLTTHVEGEGDLRPATLPVPSKAEGFKIYPLKEQTREMTNLRSEQVYIPQSTNATEIGAIVFSYFNPETRTFEVSKAGPWKITFTEKPEKPVETAIRMIDTTTHTIPSTGVGQGVTLDQMNKGLHRYLHLAVPALAVLIACFIFFQCYGPHTRIGFVLAVLVTGIGLAMGYHARRISSYRVLEVNMLTTVRFAPSSAAKPLFVLQPGTQVIPLETAGDWKRIDANGRRGWMESAPLTIK